MALLTVENLNFQYEQQILKDVSFQVQEGELLTIFGVTKSVGRE